MSVITNLSAQEILSEMSFDKVDDALTRYKLFVANAEVWNSCEGKPSQGRVLDVISNALFYWPLPKSLVYTQKISLAALRRFVEYGTMLKNTHEHFYPRKQTTAMFFKAILQNELTFDDFITKYVNQYGKYHITTPMENKALAKAYEKINFETWEDAYEYCDIALVDDPTYGIMMIESRRQQLSDQLNEFFDAVANGHPQEFDIVID